MKDDTDRASEGGAANWITPGEYDFQSGRITVTITLAEYRALVGKAALFDEAQRAAVEPGEGAGRRARAR